MEQLSIAKLLKKRLLISQPIVDLFNIYTEHIRPFLDKDALRLEQNRALFKPAFFIKREKTYLLTNNFELYCLMKSHSIDQDILQQSILVGMLDEEDFSFGLAFYELIDIVSRHKTTISLKGVYQELRKILTPELTRQLFSKNIFAITKFCALIGTTEQSYHARSDVRV